MYKLNHPEITFYQFDSFHSEKGIQHIITTKKGGVSSGIAEGLNLSFTVNDLNESVEKNRNILAEGMQVPSERLIFPLQTHSNHFKIITEKNYHEPIADTDALITKEKNIAIGILSADCVPVLLFDRKEKVIAAIHAGWKGTVNGIVRNVLMAMQSEFNSMPENIIAGIGPSICADHYEVGMDVIEKFKQNFKNSEILITNYYNDKAKVNLWEANKTWLTEFGIPNNNIEISGICTFSNPDLFYSARFTKNRTGRFSAVIKLK